MAGVREGMAINGKGYKEGHVNIHLKCCRQAYYYGFPCGKIELLEIVIEEK